jgi:hypothetical protein
VDRLRRVSRSLADYGEPMLGLVHIVELLLHPRLKHRQGWRTLHRIGANDFESGESYGGSAQITLSLGDVTLGLRK